MTNSNLSDFMEQKKKETAVAITILKALLADPTTFQDVDEVEARTLLQSRLEVLETSITLSGDVTTHFHSSDRVLADSSGTLPLANNSIEVTNHLNNVGSPNPHNISYIILGSDLANLTFENAGDAIQDKDLPHLLQVRTLIIDAINAIDFSGYEPAFTKNTAFNKDFGTIVDTVAEGSHNHDTSYSPIVHNHDSSYEPIFTKLSGFNKDFGVIAGTVAEGDHSHTDYELVFTKNTAFNKSFGIGIGTVAEGNHIHTGYEPAFTKNNAFNKEFGAVAGMVAEGNHNHNGIYSLNTHNHDGTYEPVFTKLSGFNKSFGIIAGTVAEGNHNHDTVYSVLAHNHDGTYEPVFTKNDAFNKEFGVIAGTVAEGDHVHGDYEPVTVKNTAYNKNFGVNADEVSEGNHNHDGTYEPVFVKNTAFNKNFGTAIGEVAEGNHGHTPAEVGLDNVLNETQIPVSEKGAPLGVATLDLNSKIALINIPDTILGQVNFINLWDASTNTPALPDATTVKGDYYITQVAGVYNTISFDVGDWVISNGIEWGVVNNTDAVRTVFGRNGDIIAMASDYSAFYEPIFTKLSAFNKEFGTIADSVAMGNHNHDTVYSVLAHNHDGTYEPVFTKNDAFNKNFGVIADTIAEGNHNHNGVYEPIFTKLSGFNKDFGIIAGTVSEGNHLHTEYASKIEVGNLINNPIVATLPGDKDIVNLFGLVDFDEAYFNNKKTVYDVFNDIKDKLNARPELFAVQDLIGITGEIQLIPEFQNAVFSALSFVDTLGVMTTEYDSVQDENYYKWNSVETATQSYGIVSFIQLPNNFTSWTDISFDVKTEGASSINVKIFDTQGNEILNTPNSTLATWTTVSLTAPNLATLNSTGDWSGSKFKIILELNSINDESCFFGHMFMNYDKF